MSDGYIKLYRQIFDNELWTEKPFSRAQAWIDLLLKANYKTKTCVIKGKTITIKRGQLLRGEDTLAHDWGWSRGKVRRFLTYLDKKGNISKNGTAVGTLITVENYETFQGCEPAHSTSDGTADGTGEKKVKESKRIEREKFPPSLAQVSEYVAEMNYTMDAAKFYDYYSETEWRKKNGQQIRDWKAAVRTWERREKEFAKSDKPTNANPVIEPPKYKVFEPEPEVDAVQMPDEIRKSINGLFKV